MVADARGFNFSAHGGGHSATMGETIELRPDLRLEAQSPLSCRFTLIHDGVECDKQENTEYHFNITEPGKYRLEADLWVAGEWIPWVYTNPIEVAKAKAPGAGSQ
jgi:hypothetical protein